MSMPAVWGALAVAAALVAAGAQGIVSPASSILGWGLLVIGGSLGVGLLGAVLRERAAVSCLTRWLRLWADFGTTHIQNAGWVHTEGDAAQLHALFLAWETDVEAGVNEYCTDGEAARIEYLDVYTPVYTVSIVTPDDAHVRSMATEMVRRMRELLLRIDRREASLKKWRVSNLETRPPVEVYGVLMPPQ